MIVTETGNNDQLMIGLIVFGTLKENYIEYQLNIIFQLPILVRNCCFLKASLDRVV